MRISVLSLTVSLIGAVFVQAQTEPATPELQLQALDLLRQKIAQQRQQPAEVMPPIGLQPVEVMPASSAQPMQADLQQQAIERLREAMAQAEREGAPVQVTPPSPPSKKTVRPKSKAPVKAQPGSQPAPVVGPDAPVIGGAPDVFQAPLALDQPVGVKTKQQRLMDLLDEYRADKMTPAEYQVQRAKILAEP